MRAAFTHGARRAIVLANGEAARLGHPDIGTGHLLLGVIREGEDVAADVLAELGLGLGLDDVRADVREAADTDEGRPTGRVRFTTRAKVALELALREGLRHRRICVNPQWILVGLLEEGQGTAAQILRKRGIEPARAERTRHRLAMDSFAQGLLLDRHHRTKRYPSLCPRCATTPDEHARLQAHRPAVESAPRGAWKVTFCAACGTTLEIRIR